ncbi:MAG: RoPhREQ2 gp58 [Streptosporangiaceae bacterium]|nr:RoPhREQ2 gp58 [Streptosporangiaceae bacterium]
MLDLTETIAPRSDQMNSDDLMSGPRTFTITEVRKTGSEDQPVAIYLAEFPADRPFKPSKSMRRVMVAAWTKDASTYVGKRLTLYRDETVRFGGQDVGGIRIQAMSHLDKPLKLALTVSKGKRAPYVVQPLADVAPKPPAEPGITDAQSKQLFAALNDNKLSDRDAALAYISQEVGREIGNTKELTTREASLVIDGLGAQPTTGGAA